MSQSTHETVADRRRAMKAVLASSFIGSTIEFYDFLLFASAATLVFPTVFFQHLDARAGLLASYGLFAAGYLARPLGGILFGHFGDRLGRKRALMVTIFGMGAVSTLVGLVPSGAAIGSWGAILVVLLRILQGVFLGGEWGGATLMGMEHANKNRRGFAASFASAGGPAGATLATFAMGAAAALPAEQFLSWGWRVPFLFSSALMVVGLIIRIQTTESPLFTQAMALAKNQTTPPRMPLLAVLRRPWPVIVTAIATVSAFAFTSFHFTFGISLAVAGGLGKSAALLTFASCQLVGSVLLIGAAGLSDRFGRRPIMIGSLLAHAAAVFFIIHLLGSGSIPFVAAGYLISILFYSGYYGPAGAFISEQFPTESRYTGASLGYAIAGILGGFTPAFLVTVQGDGDTGPVVVVLIAICLMSALFVWLAGESRLRDIAPTPSASQGETAETVTNA